MLDEFIRRNRQDKSLLTRIRDAIVRLVRKLTGAERRQALTAVGRLNAALDAAARNVREGEKKAAPKDGTKYIIKTFPNGWQYVEADRMVILGNDPKEWKTQLQNQINGKIRRGKDVRFFTEDGGVLTLTKATAGEMSSDHHMDNSPLSEETFYVKVNAAAHIDELIQASKDYRGDIDKGGVHGEDAANGWRYRRVYFRDFDGKYYSMDISIARGVKENVVYGLGNIRERSFLAALHKASKGSSVKDGAQSEKAFKNIKAQEEEKVNPPDPAKLRQFEILQRARGEQNNLETGIRTVRDLKLRAQNQPKKLAFY